MYKGSLYCTCQKLKTVLLIHTLAAGLGRSGLPVYISASLSYMAMNLSGACYMM
jgi:hypothetical protein